VLLSGNAAARLLADQQQLEQAGMNASPEVVRLACKRRLRSRLALQALTDSERGAGNAP
jgi:hypothetical protein